MTYEEALSYIHATPNFARGASLGRIRALLEELGEPQKKLKFVHIAGTNGKGSTAAIVASVLQAAGYRTGLYTSPYLEKFNERMRLNGAAIGDEDLAELTEQLQAAVRRLEEKGVESPNEFERVTGLALCWFLRQRADIVVLEVGLGGRYDATNVIEAPEVCAITSISLDHTAVLGNTVEEIAWEKGGILKEWVPCVLSPDQPEGVRGVIRTIAGQVGAPLVESSLAQIQVLHRDLTGLRFSWMGWEMHLPLLGGYQCCNLSTALSIVHCLRLKGWKLTMPTIQAGMEQVTWPGRLELLHGRYLLDCGHNPGGIAALCEELDTTFQGRRIFTVMGMLGDKAYEDCLTAVARRSQAFFAVSPPSPRALPVEEIAQVARQECAQVTAVTSVEEGLIQASQAAGADGLVVLCGSIPLVGAGRGFLQATTPTATSLGGGQIK